MGDIADSHVDNFASGRWGQRVSDRPAYPTTTRSSIADRDFMIVEVVGKTSDPASVATNRVPGTHLIVCDNTDTRYWVWASIGITGIAKGSCKVLADGLSINQALARQGRKPYVPHSPPSPAHSFQDISGAEAPDPSEEPARERNR